LIRQPIQTIKLAHFRLAFSRQMFVVTYPRETQEMVFDAHNQAFAFFCGVEQIASCRPACRCAWSGARMGC